MPTETYRARTQKLKQKSASYSAKKQDSTFAHILEGWCLVPERCSKQAAASDQGKSLSHCLYAYVQSGGRNIRPFLLLILSCPFPPLPGDVPFFFTFNFPLTNCTINCWDICDRTLPVTFTLCKLIYVIFYYQVETDKLIQVSYIW